MKNLWGKGNPKYGFIQEKAQKGQKDIWSDTFSEGNSRGAGIDGVEDSFIANLRFGDEADLGAEVRDASASASHDHWSVGLSKTETKDVIK